MLLIVSSVCTYWRISCVTRPPSSIIGGIISQKTPVATPPATTNDSRIAAMRNFSRQRYWKNFTIGNNR